MPVSEVIGARLAADAKPVQPPCATSEAPCRSGARRPDQRIVAIEVKLSGSVTDDDVKNLHWLRDQIGDDLLDAVVIHTGPQAYRRRDGVAVVPAALIGP